MTSRFAICALLPPWCNAEAFRAQRSRSTYPSRHSAPDPSLEEHVGLRLFDRDSRNVQLTVEKVRNDSGVGVQHGPMVPAAATRRLGAAEATEAAAVLVRPSVVASPQPHPNGPINFHALVNALNCTRALPATIGGSGRQATLAGPCPRISGHVLFVM